MLRKKILLLFLLGLMAVLCLTVPAWASDTTVGPVAPASVNINQEFDVNVTISGNSETVAGADFTLSFDKDKLEITKFAKGDFLSTILRPDFVMHTGQEEIPQINESGQVIFAAMGNNSNPSGTFLTITFKAKKAGTADLTMIDAKLAKSATEVIPCTLRHATVTINDTTPPAQKPAVLQFQPAAGATGVALNAPVKAVFNMDVTAADLSGVTIKDAVNNPVAGVSASLGADNRTLNIAHAAFAYDTSYSVTIPAGAVKNAQGATNDLITWAFTTVAQPAPQPLIVTVNLEGDNISPDRPLTINGTAKKGETPTSVNWLVNVIDSSGIIVATFSPARGATFTQTYTPELDLPVVADYTVQVKATPESGSPVTVEKTFKVYNYPLKLIDLSIAGSGATRTIEASVTNLSANAVDQAKVFCQVTKTEQDGTIVVKSLQKADVNVASGGTENISFNINVPAEPGNYKVELFVWSNAGGRWVTLGQQVEADLVL